MGVGGKARKAETSEKLRDRNFSSALDSSNHSSCRIRIPKLSDRLPPSTHACPASRSALTSVREPYLSSYKDFGPSGTEHHPPLPPSPSLVSSSFTSVSYPELEMAIPFKEALARLENKRVKSTRPLIPPQILQEDLPLYVLYSYLFSANRP